MPHFQDDIYLGGSPGAGGIPPNDLQGVAGQPSLMPGVGPLGRVHIFDILPLATQTNNAATALTSGGAATFTTLTSPGLVAGTGATLVTLADGTPAIQFDTDRCVSLTSAGNLSAATVTITGYDRYGQRLSFSRAGPNANTVVTTKAFRGIISIATSAALGTAMTVGTSNVFGLPVAIPSANYVIKASYNGVLAQDAGTLVAADGTSPATATTGDVRGTYAPSGVTSGTQRVTLALAVTAIQAGPNATRLGAYGVNQNLAA
ncbi:hypothetical protein UFOVP435_33 [uncultured Caudovirales phage]|uniref:Uncharacterized protein n=1 Tax=uncultured Caudovirales phage TaxID=2100421 RepID=A0A6J5MGR8_9CAUD|nr:hypothetical protein UFOVP435_33 [uncultured Caudovirales phage]